MFSQASVILSTGGVTDPLPPRQNPQADTPPGQTQTLDKRQTPPQADTPCPVHAGIYTSPCPVYAGIHPSCPVHAGIHVPARVATAADGTHLTRMHSCNYLLLQSPLDYLIQVSFFNQ